MNIIEYYKNNLTTTMLTAIVVGVLLGIVAPELMLGTALIGELFLRLLTLLVVPVIVLSILSGVTNLNGTGSLARLGIKTLAYYTITTALAVCVGLILVNTLQPGKGENTGLTIQETISEESSKNVTLSDVARNIIPTNVVQAATKGNVLGLIFFSFFLGVGLLSINSPKKDIVIDTISVLFDSVIWMIEKTMLLAPLGFFSLTGSIVAEYVIQDKLGSFGGAIGLYTATVAAGLLAHGIIILPILAKCYKIKPIQFANAMAPALTTAFSTASSAATLPITLDRLEKKAGVSNKISSFVAPLGATVNMDGTAIYEAVAVVFIANMYGMDLTFTAQFMIFLTATFSAIGAAGIPGAGLIMMVLVLGSVGLPAEGVKLVLVVDRLLDMMRTCLNVWGDSIGAAIIAKSEQETLKV